ncbi:MAG: Gx transporter family protein [Oscillospiraceae bacterium]|nr:Gx transporter family protein [Oscillospiraceae bacterium]
MIRPEKMSPAKYTAVMGLLFAAAAALNMLESIFSAFLPAGIRVGLSNIVIMTAILCINLPSAALLTLLKAGMVLMTRGLTAGIMSLCGSFAAFAVTALLFRKTGCSYILISVLGALAHSFGQLCAASALLGTVYVFAYAPVLAIASTVTGVCTGLVLKTVFPLLRARF